MNLKSLFKKNTLTYRLWFYLNRGKLDSTVRLPNKSDQYYFDGYPRSGNTFFGGMLGYAFQDKKGTSHLHAVAGLKLAMNAGIKHLFIIYRHPLDAVVSLVFGKFSFLKMDMDDELLITNMMKSELEEWISYYTYIHNHQKDIQLISFEEVSVDNELFLSKLEQVFAQKINNKHELIQTYEESMRALEKRKEVSFSALPNQRRKDFKAKYSELLKAMPNYPKAVELNDLLKKTSNNL